MRHYRYSDLKKKFCYSCHPVQRVPEADEGNKVQLNSSFLQKLVQSVLKWKQKGLVLSNAPGGKEAQAA